MGMKSPNGRRGATTHLETSMVAGKLFLLQAAEDRDWGWLHLSPAPLWSSPSHRGHKTKMPYVNKTTLRPIPSSRDSPNLPILQFSCLLASPCRDAQPALRMRMEPRSLRADSRAWAPLPLSRWRLTAAPPEPRPGPRRNKYASSRQRGWVNQTWQ